MILPLQQHCLAGLRILHPVIGILLEGQGNVLAARALHEYGPTGTDSALLISTLLLPCSFLGILLRPNLILIHQITTAQQLLIRVPHLFARSRLRRPSGLTVH